MRTLQFLALAPSFIVHLLLFRSHMLCCAGEAGSHYNPLLLARFSVVPNRLAQEQTRPELRVTTPLMD